MVIKSMEGADLRGVVLRASAFVGYADWTIAGRHRKAVTARHLSRIGSLMPEAGPQLPGRLRVSHIASGWPRERRRPA